jgi:DNA topoisomerase-3
VEPVIKAWLVHPQTGKTAFFDNLEYLHTAQTACRGKTIGHVQAASTREATKPEKLLNITRLQKKAFKLYGYTPEKTLETAQALYEKHKCPSYPRTPSRVMGDQNMDLFREKYRLLAARYPDYAQDGPNWGLSKDEPMWYITSRGILWESKYELRLLIYP